MSDSPTRRAGAMEVGIALPQAGDRASPEALTRAAIEAEAIGMDSVWVMDRLLRPHAPVSQPGAGEIVLAEPYGTVFDPIGTLCHLAAETETIRLGTSAIQALLQPPVLLARRLATLDRLSEGRLIVGNARGWMREEFAISGVSPSTAGAGLDEYVTALRQVWGPDPVSFDGTVYRIPPADIGPKPTGDLDLYMGYPTDAGIRTAARIADGLHPFARDLESLQRDVELFRAEAESAGRDVDDLGVIVRVAARGSDESPADTDRPLLHGTTDQWLADLHSLDALGVEHVCIGMDLPLTAQLDLVDGVLSELSR